MKIPQPELFKGKHDGKTVRKLINALNTYYKSQVLRMKLPEDFVKKNLSDIVCNCDDFQGNNNNITIPILLIVHLKEHFIALDYSKHKHISFIYKI